MASRLRKGVLGLSVLLTSSMLATPAFAHPGHQGSGFLGGFLHPMLGLDHLLAMVAVGFWAAQHTRTARWLLPVAFPFAMLLGAAISMAGWAFPGVEAGIAGSDVVLGLLIAFAVRLPTAAGVTLVSLIALAHGYAHASEMLQGGSAIAYGSGFFAATALLHLLGFVLSLLGKHKAAARTIAIVGAAISAVGMYWLESV